MTKLHCAVCNKKIEDENVWIDGGTVNAYCSKEHAERHIKKLKEHFLLK